ncbi:MAG TPA: hypothetical protein VED46_03485 [Alphaproteobacteria bacterium]|nr:hypothetical protein [Alphaproteobacteria bacterium]
MTDVFREVDEEVRREQLLKLWRRYSKYVIAAIVLVVGLAAALYGWRQWQEQRRIERADAYLSASAIPAAEAIEAYKAMGNGDGYGMLARLREAALLAELGRKAEAVAAFEAIASDAAVPRVYRDLALLLFAQHALGQADSGDLIRRLEPLTAADNPWRFSAMELTALAELQAGNTARARSLFLSLADDPAAPAGVRGRAAEILATIPAS